MTKHKRTKAQEFERIAAGIKAIKENKSIPRAKAKDGSVPTHPIVEVPDLLESEILKQCISWLKKRRIYCRRHDTGGGYLGQGTAYATYGIIGAGDIIGLLPNGVHFEIECKAGKGGRLSKQQQKHKKEIETNNGFYFIVHGIAELEFYFLKYGLL